MVTERSSLSLCFSETNHGVWSISSILFASQLKTKKAKVHQGIYNSRWKQNLFAYLLETSQLSRSFNIGYLEKAPS